MTEMFSKCPECNKEIPIQDLRKTQFCSMICERNYRYRMRHMDVTTGEYMDPKKVRKL